MTPINNHLRFILLISLIGFASSFPNPSAAEDTPAADTSAVAAPKEEKSEPPASPERFASYIWQEIDLAMTSLKADVAKRDYARAQEGTAKIMELAHRVVENPLSKNGEYFKYLQGVEEHVRVFAETLNREAQKGNAPNVDYSFRKVSQMIDNLKTSYYNVPVPPPDTAAAATAPAPKKQKAAEPAVKAETPSDTSAKPAAAAKPKPAAPPAGAPANPAPSKKK